MFQPIRAYHVIVSTYSVSVPWSRDESRLSIHIMWSIPQSRDVQGRKLETIKYSVRDMADMHFCIFQNSADHICHWLFSMWVPLIFNCVITMLMRLVLGLPDCKWLLYLIVFEACCDTCPWLLSLWVTAIPYFISSLLIVSAFGSSVGE